MPTFCVPSRSLQIWPAYVAAFAAMTKFGTVQVLKEMTNSRAKLEFRITPAFASDGRSPRPASDLRHALQTTVPYDA
jgi:hypothetical protein